MPSAAFDAWLTDTMANLVRWAKRARMICLSGKRRPMHAPATHRKTTLCRCLQSSGAAEDEAATMVYHDTYIFGGPRPAATALAFEAFVERCRYSLFANRCAVIEQISTCVSAVIRIRTFLSNQRRKQLRKTAAASALRSHGGGVRRKSLSS